MGWDVYLLRVRAGALPPLPAKSSELADDARLQDIAASELEALISRHPAVRPNGPGGHIWDEGSRGLMELQISDGSIFVGHAKLEPVLALHTMLEAHRPGWLILDVGTALLHDPETLRREMKRRQEVADAYRRDR